MSKKSLEFVINGSTESRRCRAIPACKGKSYVNDLNPPADVARKSRARVMIVGEAPGSVENKTGRPFAGASGKILDHALQSAGLDRNDVFITNTINCELGRDNGEGHRKPARAELDACSPLLQAEIETLRPAVIVTMGDIAKKAIVTMDFPGISIINSIHPAAGMHRPSIRDAVNAEIEKKIKESAILAKK